jgi:hypothetical protein
MKQNKMKNHAQTQKKDACPKTASKQNQGTGKELFDATKEKSTGPDIDIITGFTFAATPGLHAHLEHFDKAEWQILNTTLSDAHHDIIQMVLSILAAKGIAVSSLDGEVLRFTLQFLKNIPEEP